jgi:hypothetical protein
VANELSPGEAARLLAQADAARRETAVLVDHRAAGRYWLAIGVSVYAFTAGVGLWSISPAAHGLGPVRITPSLIPVMLLFDVLIRGARDRLGIRPREYAWQTVLGTTVAVVPLIVLLFWPPADPALRLWLWLLLPLIGVAVSVWFAVVQFARAGESAPVIAPTPIRPEAWLTVGIGLYCGVATATAGLSGLPHSGLLAALIGEGVLVIAFVLVVRPQHGAAIKQLADWWSLREWGSLTLSAAVFLAVTVLAGWSSLPLVPLAIAGGILAGAPLGVRGLAALRRAA